MMPDFDIQAAYNNVVAIVRTLPEVRNGFHSLLAYCDSIYPDNAYEELAAFDVELAALEIDTDSLTLQQGLAELATLDIEADLATLQHWLVDVLTQEPPKDYIQELFFGIVCFSSDPFPVYTLHAAGIPSSYQNGHEEYLPGNRYASSHVLNEISRVVFSLDPEAKSICSYVLCLGYAALAVDAICRLLGVTHWNDRAVPFAISVGFDHGDIISLSPVPQ